MSATPVIIVHGLWVHGLVMRLLARRITRCGFDTRVWSYPTMRRSLSENAARLAHYCTRRGVTRVHIVAHSMGGLVALKMLEATPAVHCERLLLLGTPYTDSAAARRLMRFPGGSRLLGRSIAEWLAGARPAVRAEAAGVIAGARRFGLGALIGSDLQPAHDGVVAVAETAVPGVSEHITLPVSHTEMLFSRAVARQCCAFLRHGRFDPVQS